MHRSEEQLQAKFRMLDKDGNGFLYKNEFRVFWDSCGIAGCPERMPRSLLRTQA